MRSTTDTPAATAFDHATGHDNMQQLIQLRWIAVVGQIATIAIVHFGFGVRLPLDSMLAVLAGRVCVDARGGVRDFWPPARIVCPIQAETSTTGIPYRAVYRSRASRSTAADAELHAMTSTFTPASTSSSMIPRANARTWAMDRGP